MHGISVLNGGSLFDREARGWTSKDRNGRPTLSLESPLEPTVDIGSRCFKIGVVRAAFNHGYHVLGTRFVGRAPPGYSLLCPALLNGKHVVISSRSNLLQEQAMASSGFWRPSQHVGNFFTALDICSSSFRLRVSEFICSSSLVGYILDQRKHSTVSDRTSFRILK